VGSVWRLLWRDGDGRGDNESVTSLVEEKARDMRYLAIKDERSPDRRLLSSKTRGYCRRRAWKNHTEMANSLTLNSWTRGIYNKSIR
jgi:hypothetical protein